MSFVKSFSVLNSLDYNLSRICAMNQNWVNSNTFLMDSPRSTNALLLFCNSDAVFENLKTKEVISVPCKSLFFLPAGSCYKWTFSPDENENISTTLFEFLLNDDNGDCINIGEDAKILDTSNFKLNNILFQNIISELAKPDYSFPKIKAHAYSLISSISARYNENHISSGNIRCIYPGIKYLREDPLQEKSVREIAALCNVSINYFEKLFKEYAGCSPSQYRLLKKIDKAKLLLATESLTIGQIAYELDFDDCAYFCRVFKKLCGCTPSQYRLSLK